MNPINPTTSTSTAPVRQGEGETRGMLDRWATMMPDRRTIQEFLEWLQSHDDHRDKDVLDLHLDRILDEYHEIDQRQLDRERRALLDAHRSAHV